MENEQLFYRIKPSFFQNIVRGAIPCIFFILPRSEVQSISLYCFPKKDIVLSIRDNFHGKKKPSEISS